MAAKVNSIFVEEDVFLKKKKPIINTFSIFSTEFQIFLISFFIFLQRLMCKNDISFVSCFFLFFFFYLKAVTLREKNCR